MVLQGQEPLTILLQGLDYIMKFSIGLPRPSCSTARFQPRVEYVGPLQLVKEVLQKSGVIGITSAEFSHVILHPTTGSTPPTSVEYTLTLHDHAFIKAHPLQVIFLNGTFYIDVDPSPQILRSSARKISSKVPFNTSDRLFRRDHAQALEDTSSYIITRSVHQIRQLGSVYILVTDCITDKKIMEINVPCGIRLVVRELLLRKA